MIKKILSVLIIITIISIGLNTNKAHAINESYDSRYIKVGLERISAKPSISLKGEGFSVEIANGNMTKLFDINSQDIVAKTKDFSYHIELSEVFSSYDSALKKAKDLKLKGVESYVTYRQGYQVWVGEFKSEDSANQFLTASSNLGSESVKISKNPSLITLESAKGERYIAFDKDQNIYIKSLGGINTVEKSRYRGYIGFINNKNNIRIVNYVQIGDYLKGVVPREMSASWEIEALKAQAVSARNYALRNLDKHKSLGYDLCDATNCQVYEGHGIEDDRTNRAISETRDKVLRYNDEIAQTFYYSCSGGYTVSNEDAWNGTPIPYLRGKRDPYSDSTPQSNWEYKISKAEAAKKLKAKGYDVGQIISLQTMRDSLGHRVLELKVIGTSATKVIPKEKIRDVFGYSNIKSTNYNIVGSNTDVAIPSLPLPVPTEPEKPAVDKDVYVLSANDNTARKKPINGSSVISADGVKKVDLNSKGIVISNGVKLVVIESNKKQEQTPSIPNPPTVPSGPSNALNTIVFKGSGWGHGVGMSQYGALNMAKAGRDFKEILEFYFTGTRVE